MVVPHAWVMVPVLGLIIGVMVPHGGMHDWMMMPVLSLFISVVVPHGGMVMPLLRLLLLSMVVPLLRLLLLSMMVPLLWLLLNMFMSFQLVMKSVTTSVLEEVLDLIFGHLSI